MAAKDEGQDVSDKEWVVAWFKEHGYDAALVRGGGHALRILGESLPIVSGCLQSCAQFLRREAQPVVETYALG